MPNGDVPAAQLLEGLFAEDLGNKTHFFMNADLLSIRNRDARTFLPSVLQSEKTEEGDTCHVFAPSVNAKDTALFFGAFHPSVGCRVWADG